MRQPVQITPSRRRASVKVEHELRRAEDRARRVGAVLTLLRERTSPPRSGRPLSG